MKRTTRFLGASAAVLLATSQLFAQPIIPRLNPAKVTATSSRAFGFQLFQALSEKKTGPVAVSPMSIVEALSLAANGAEMETRTELESLFVSAGQRKLGADLGTITGGLDALRKQLKQYAKDSNGAFEYSSANSLWANSNPSVGFRFSNDFLKLAKDSYGATLKERDFAAPGQATVNEINKWVDTETNHKISKLLSQLKAEDAAVLLNAIYAKGKFLEHFSTLEEGKYKTQDGKEVGATFMTKTSAVNTYTDKNVKAFSFAVGTANTETKNLSDQLAIDILVPRDGKLASLVEVLTGSYYSDIVAGLKGKQLKLTMPAGKVEQKDATKLKEVLIGKFQAPRSFDEALAQFGPLGTVADKKNLFISEVLTKTFYEVSPFGFEAAAATAVIISRESAVINPPKVDEEKIAGAAIHVIRHIPSGMPLFIVEYDSTSLYDEAKIVELVAVGHKARRTLSAQTKNGTIGVAYDKDKPVVALLDKDRKIVKVLKALE